MQGDAHTCVLLRLKDRKLKSWKTCSRRKLFTPRTRVVVQVFLIPRMHCLPHTAYTLSFPYARSYYELAHSVQEEVINQPMYLRPPNGASLREYQVCGSDRR